MPRLLRTYIVALHALVAFVCLTVSANAVTCFAVGGSFTWDGTNTGGGGTGGIKWASATGGSSACAGSGTGGSPGSGDSATFDGSSGGGTVTVAATFNGSNTLVNLTFGAFTGTLDFATNNPNVTITTLFSGTGTGTRTLSMGNGVWTFGGGTSATWNFLTTTSLTLNINSSTMVWVGASSPLSFFGGGKTWGALTINANVSTPQVAYQFETGTPASDTFASLTVNAPATLYFRAGQTQTFTGGITVSGSSASSLVYFNGDGVSATGATIASGAVSNVSSTAWRDIAGATSAINATNSYNLMGNSGTLSITAPTAGCGGHIIGG